MVFMWSVNSKRFMSFLTSYNSVMLKLVGAMFPLFLIFHLYVFGVHFPYIHLMSFGWMNSLLYKIITFVAVLAVTLFPQCN